MLVISIAVRNCWRMRLDWRAVALGVAAVAVAVVLGAVAGVVAALAGLVPAVLWQVAPGRQAEAGAAADLHQVPRLRPLITRGPDDGGGRLGCHLRHQRMWRSHTTVLLDSCRNRGPRR
jgi:hypothetical protein